MLQFSRLLLDPPPEAESGGVQSATRHTNIKLGHRSLPLRVERQWLLYFILLSPTELSTSLYEKLQKQIL